MVESTLRIPMIAIKLYDGTVIYARDYKIGNTAIFVENFRYRKGDESPTFIEDGMSVHNDSIETYMICHAGEKNEEVSEN